MAAKRWLGLVAAVKQVSTITISGTVNPGDTFTVTCGTAAITSTASSSNTTTTASELLTALNTQGKPSQFNDMLWSSASNVVTATGVTAGQPFVITAGTSGSATVNVATTTAATGPNFANVAANWSGGTLPTTADTITVEANSPDILYGLTSNTDVIAKFTVEAGFTGRIGLPERNARGYREYRDQHLSMNITALEVGSGPGRGSSLVKIDLKSTGTAVSVFSTGQRESEEEDPLQLKGGTAATAIISSGTVSISGRADEASAFTSISVGSDATVTCGVTCTHTSVTTRGTTTLAAAVTNLVVQGGQCICYGQVTNANITAGSFVYRASDTIADLDVGPGVLDCSDIRARTISALELRPGAQVIDPYKTITATAITIGTNVKGLTVQ
ncbi:hypothetical protein VN12_04345 [Pirellula sp. SH-Sr6A]|uniref:hypothetical protein n=1 Tax=Pirellula sp. SH-Sr6A TaxID=1632865 RepID=UPI00078D8E87|nr:hypothetical protein [Pirellula sp. SH-Sr6A]AMV31323.1 hypothetical protein VN12_04345 [Pirellula sp. SH-Sr6A]